MVVLIIYELVPEDTKFYTVEVTDEEWEWMRLTHGHFVNQEMPDEATETACLQLNEWLVNKKPFVSLRPIATDGINCILHTGFIL